MQVNIRNSRINAQGKPILHSMHTKPTRPTSFFYDKEYIPTPQSFYIESYGCQMNFADSEIVASVMQQKEFTHVEKIKEADIIFINTCAIREKAEETIRTRIRQFNTLKKKKPEIIIGILGCMAERVKNKLLEEEKLVDLVAGPDAYRDLPNLVQQVVEGYKAVNVLLSREETYADITPIKVDKNQVTAFVSIMRGCNNVCSFCIVPYTRGRERSRNPYSIISEAKYLFERGYREVTLLGQNVDSYCWATDSKKKTKNSNLDEINFAKLLSIVAEIDPKLRIRFSTSHPKDITDEVLYTIKKYENICKYIHLPVQSGNSRVLKLMNRTYDRLWYLERIQAIRNILGDECGISSDIMTGFCTETEAEHQDTLSLMDTIIYDFAYMFAYSERPGTLAAKKYQDDVSKQVKQRRLQEIIDKQRAHSLQRNQQALNKTYKVLIEGASKRSPEYLQGRNSANKLILFPKGKHQKGEYVKVKIQKCTSATLMGEVIF